MKIIVITRHTGLVQYLHEIGIVKKNDVIIAHATEGDVDGNVVIGVLPSALACHAACVVEVPLNMSPEDRGKDLPVERVREIAGKPVVYQTRQLLFGRQPQLRASGQMKKILRERGIV
jgi:hypothetical protein